jgi:hypothetical protein
VAVLTLVETGPRRGRPSRRASQARTFSSGPGTGLWPTVPPIVHCLAGKQIASHFAHHERWGRLVNRAGRVPLGNRILGRELRFLKLRRLACTR